MLSQLTTPTMCAGASFTSRVMELAFCPSIEITRALPHLYVRMIEKNKQMTSPDVLLALVRCELKARYNGWVAGSYAAF